MKEIGFESGHAQPDSLVVVRGPSTSTLKVYGMTHVVVMIYVMTGNVAEPKERSRLFERFSRPIARGLALLGKVMWTRRHIWTTTFSGPRYWVSKARKWMVSPRCSLCRDAAY